MNDQLQKKLLEWMNNGEAFVKEQAPDYVNQAMAYYAWDAQRDFILGLWYLGIAGLFLLLLLYTVNKRRYELEVLTFVSFLCVLGFTITGSISTYFGYSSMKKIEIAPKVFIVDKLMSPRCGK